MEALRILLAEDHIPHHQGVRRILQERPEWEVVAETQNGGETVLQAAELKPDVAILDITMPHLDGAEATRQIAWQVPEVNVLALSVHMEESYVLQVLRAGAKGYLLKDSLDEDLLQAVTAVSEGKSFLSPSVARVMLDGYIRRLKNQAVTDRFGLLSKREREVLQLIGMGHNNKGIAQILGLRPSTVKTHRAKLIEKLDLHSTAEIVRFAVRKGFPSGCPMTRVA